MNLVLYGDGVKLSDLHDYAENTLKNQIQVVPRCGCSRYLGWWRLQNVYPPGPLKDGQPENRGGGRQ